MNAWRVVELLAVIADESRYGLLAMLAQAGEDGMLQGRLATRSGLSLARFKRHIAKLVKAGLVRRNHRRKGVVWRIEERQLADLLDTLCLRLKSPAAKTNGHAVVIETPKGFRSLAAKLACVAPAGADSPPIARPAQPRGKSTVKARLPARLSDAIRQNVAAVTPVAGPLEPASPSVDIQATTFRAAPLSGGPATRPRAPARATKRKHPVRLSDALGGASG